ncbi:MAG: hypothetical protein J5507_06115 [Clostridia bacterium]|nr:hypothetical protein [Clostridia bacterium]
MKKLFKYFLMFIALFLFVELCTNFSMKERFNNEPEYKINVTSPKIEVTQNKASDYNGYITGTVTNDTGEHLRNKFLQFDFYNKDGVYLGTEVQEIKIFNINEKTSFNIEYKYTNVDKIEINFVDEVNKIEKDKSMIGNLFNFEEDEDVKKIAIPLGLLLGIYVILP